MDEVKKMRLRNVKGSREMIATNDFVVHEEETMKGKWHDFFENENPIHIEVGMGKGRFIIDLSLIHISEPTRRTPISYAVFCLKKKKTHETGRNLIFLYR